MTARVRAVIGVPDDRWGEVPRAVVVPEAGVDLDPDEVPASPAGRLAKYKIPKSPVVADELPRTASRKLLKSRVREHCGPRTCREGPVRRPDRPRLPHLFIPLFTELRDVRGVTTKVNYGLNRVRFPAPVKAGSRIRLAARLASVEEVPGGVQIAVDGTVEIDGGGKPAAVLQSLSPFYA